MAMTAVSGLPNYVSIPREHDNYPACQIAAEQSTASAPSAKTSLKPFDLPWDVFATIIENADVETLKAISLVCHDFFIESAPALYRCFAARTTPGNDPLVSQLIMLQLQTEALRHHSHSHLIKHVHVTLDKSVTRRLSDGMQMLDRFVALFQAIGNVEQLEVLELELGSAQAIITGCLRAIPLPSSLKELRIISDDPFLMSFGVEFWARHRRNLRSITIRAPPGLNSMDTPAMTKSFMSLEKLHFRNSNLTRFIAMPSTLRSLVIEQMCAPEVDQLLQAITASLDVEPTVAPPFTSSRARESAGRLVKGVESRAAASCLEEFDFGYAVGDPSLVYKTLVARMPRLRKLTARHGSFPSMWELMGACVTLVALNELEEVEWVLEQDLLVNEPYISGRGALTNCLTGNCANDNLVIGTKAAQILAGNQTLRRIVISRVSRADAGGKRMRSRDVVFTRDSANSSWVSTIYPLQH